MEKQKEGAVERWRLLDHETQTRTWRSPCKRNNYVKR
jgi:hypothetical protein